MSKKKLSGVFFHDLPIYKDVDGIYCSTTLTDKMFERYLLVVDELIIVTRVYQLDVTYEKANQERISEQRIRIIGMPNLNTFYGFVFLLPKAKKEIREIIKQSDLIFIKGGTIANIAAAEARKVCKKYQIDAAGCAWDAYWNHSIKGKLVAPIFEYLTKKDIWNAACVVYVTNHWLQDRYPTKGISTNASNVVLEDFDVSILKKRLKMLIGLHNRDTLVIGTTAALDNRAKGQHFVIEAMKILTSQINIRYELVGGGDSSYLESVAQKCGVADHVVFKGQMTHNEVLKWLDGIDFYIQPSLQEGLPRSVIEALSRGCPCLGARTGGIPELISGEYIFRRKSGSDIASKILKLFNSDLNEIAINNFDIAKQYNAVDLNSRRQEIFEKYKSMVIGDIDK